MHDVVILSGVRTPMGAFQGALSALSAPQLGAIAIREAIVRAGIAPDGVDEVLMGCVLTGGLGQAPARQAALGAGLPQSVPCTTVNKVCGSGIQSVVFAAQAIQLGDSDVVVAGGMESMTNAPYLVPQARSGLRLGHGQIMDSMIQDGLWDPYHQVHMGTCGDRTAGEFGFTREALDAYASESVRRARDAQESGRLGEEIVAVEVPGRRGETTTVALDESVGKGDPSKLPSLRPAFGKDGVTTAGNASSLNDGAAAMVLASATYAQAHGLAPLGRVVAWSRHAQAPEWFTTAPARAIEALLAKTGLSVGDIDVYEVNEAFAVVAMVVAQQVGIPHDRLNVNGGAVALGHPIGMTGTRLVLTALHEVRRRGGRYAVATPCIGGGEAVAVLLEAL